MIGLGGLLPIKPRGALRDAFAGLTLASMNIPQVLGLCAFGILVPALPWTLIGIVWAYVIVWTILTDLVKLAFYHFAASPAVETPLTAHTMSLR